MEKVKEQSSQSTILALGLATILILAIFVLLEWTRPRPGSIVIPAGGTYLGPSPTY